MTEDIRDRPMTVTFTVGTPLDKVEELMILRTLELTKDNQLQAARLLGISVKTLRRKLQGYSTPK